MADMNRRLVLVSGMATASTTALPAWASAQTTTAAPPIRDPFQLGVASGDPLPDSVVLWTRLAPAPLNPDGFGGMPDATYTVEWEIATDPGFTSVVQRGTVPTTRAQAHSVHAEPVGLRAGWEYYYRFRVGGHISPVGRTRTAPALGAPVDELRFAFGSCQHWEEGWYHSYRGMADDRPDLVLFLGDYISSKPSQQPTRVRELAVSAETTTLAAYRVRHGQHKTDADLRAAHAVAPWLIAFGEGGGPASQAFYEHMPIRSTAKREFLWGDLARFHTLDTTHYRSAQAPGDNCSVMQDPARTVTGAAQEQRLLKSFESHPTTWDFLGQQMFFAQRDADGYASTCESPDSWNGYEASRKRVTQGWLDRRVPNPVVLTGDVHKHWASDLRLNYFDHNAPVVGSEIVTTSVSSNPGFDGPPDATWFSRNPHVKYYRNQRGYVRMTVGKQLARADFMVVSNALEQDATKVSITPDVSFGVMAGRRGLQRL
nr:alkaline phosphatase D family protein [Kibdelosporangium sp. MJ126-NF4]CEL17683.1 secreted alkaline phosphatase [Kibdelosporangium sp. MJ126-NF4]CTQ91090.1 secreted alkaline phosphatase [Kibdelosporangium sp. MJ126-NF4]